MAFQYKTGRVDRWQNLAMRKLILLVETSLDGVQESPEKFIFDYLDDEAIAEHHTRVHEQAQAWIMGRHTYEGMASYWPTAEAPEASALNAMPKYVASRTLTEPLEWQNSYLLGPDPVARVEQLKHEGSGVIMQYGLGEFTKSLLDTGLIDELRFLVFPVVQASGARWFDVLDTRKLQLIESKAYRNGPVALHYRPVPAVE